MSESTYFTYNTPIGKFTIESDGEALTRLSAGSIELDGVNAPSSLTNRAANELQEYLAGRRRYFDVPLHPQGTDFQRAVWREMVDIPYGQTRTYAQIALAVGSPKGFRAVGMAANRNPLPLFVPCHRVIGSNGGLVGYALGLKMKRFLLDLERE